MGTQINQKTPNKLLSQATVSDTRVETEHGVCMVPLSSLPKMVPGNQPEKIKPLEADLQYVTDYLHENARARSVIATEFDFGWERAFVHCACLYVDGPKDTLLQVATQQEIPTIVIEGQLSNLTLTDEANRLLRLPHDKQEASERLAVLKTTVANNSRMVKDKGPFYHGQSISLTGSESRASAGAFLTADNNDEMYALTAGHAVSDPDETRVVTPGLIDILSKLAKMYPSYPKQDQTKFLVERSSQECGRVESRFMGVNEDGWRSDWALVRLSEPWKTSNGNWFDRDQLEAICIANKALFPEGFTGSEEMMIEYDPQAHQTCVKNGASTGSTFGIVGQTEAHQFVKRSADMHRPE